MLVVYAVFLVFQLKSQKNLYVLVDEVGLLVIFGNSLLFFLDKHCFFVSGCLYRLRLLGLKWNLIMLQ